MSSLNTKNAVAAVAAEQVDFTKPVSELNHRELFLAFWQSQAAFREAFEDGDAETAELLMVAHVRYADEMNRRGALAEDRAAKGFEARAGHNSPFDVKASALVTKAESWSKFQESQAKAAEKAQRAAERAAEREAKKAEKASKPKKQSKANAEIEALKAELAALTALLQSQTVAA